MIASHWTLEVAGRCQQAWLRWIAAALLGCLVIGSGVGTNHAQETSPEFDPLNHAFSVYMGSGIYVSQGRSVYVFRVAPRIRLRSEEEHAFGIRLRINATLGFFDLDPKDFLDFKFPDRVGTFALVPGVEFPIKLYSNWTLIPFLDAGAAVDTEVRDVVVVVGTGLRSRAEFNDAAHTYVLWNELIYANNLQDSANDRVDYSVFRTDLDLRGLVGFKLSKRAFDLGLMAKVEQFFDGIIIERVLLEPLQIQRKYELGLTFGPSEKWKTLRNMFTVPRIGLTYRFGDGPSGVRFVLRSRF